MNYISQLPITILEARKILGKEANIFTDEEIEHLIICLTGIADAFIKTVPKY